MISGTIKFHVEGIERPSVEYSDKKERERAIRSAMMRYKYASEWYYTIIPSHPEDAPNNRIGKAKSNKAVPASAYGKMRPRRPDNSTKMVTSDKR